MGYEITPGTNKRKLAKGIKADYDEDMAETQVKPYRLTKVVVEVLTAGDYNPPSLDQVVYDIREGAAVGLWDTEQVRTLDRDEVVAELERMGSDESFLECLGNTGEL